MKTNTQHQPAAASEEPVTDRCAPGRSTKPRFTRPSACESRRYVASKSKTDSGMLHQSRTLKAPAADKARDRHETGGGGSASRHFRLAGNMVEVSGAANAAPVTSVRAEAGAPTGASVSRRGGEMAGRKAGISSRVFVLGKSGEALMPCHPARAREMLRQGRAVIHRRYPFVIRLKDRKAGGVQPTAIKLDPGATTTGIAVVRTETHQPTNQHVLFAAELTHRGSAIRDALAQRASFRRGRRSRNLRYRAPRFLNRGGDKRGWLPPSLRHRLETTATQVARLRRFAPVAAIAMELVRFDTQLMENPDITGVEYQRGELVGYEVREYVLERGEHRCAYCDAKNVPLNLDHIVPRSLGGSSRVSNLVPACIRCNTAKSNLDVRDFVQEPARLKAVLAQTRKSLTGAAAVNATRFALREALLATGLPVATSTGGRTKWNRSRFGLRKTHAIDAACVGTVDQLTGSAITPLFLTSTGRGARKRTRFTPRGFHRRNDSGELLGVLSPAKSHFGFRTGDIVRARVPSGKKKGVHFGRVAVRATGSFNIQTPHGTIQGISHRFCSLAQRADGYGYAYTVSIRPTQPKTTIRVDSSRP